MSRLTPLQCRAAALLAEQVSVAEAARILGLRRETVSRWKRLPGFQSAVDRAVRDGVRMDSIKMRAFSALEAAFSGEDPQDFRVDLAIKLLVNLAKEASCARERKNHAPVTPP